MFLKSLISVLTLLNFTVANAQSNNLIPLNIIDLINKLKNDAQFIKSLNKTAIHYHSHQTNINELYDNLFLNFAQANSQSAGSALPNVTQPCLEQLEIFAQGIQNKSEWAISIADSFGKPTSGIFQGSVLWPGEYRECIKIENYKYCMLAKPVPPALNATLVLKLGTCLPKKCTTGDIISIINFAIDIIPFNLTDIDTTYVTCQGPKALDKSAILAITILSIITALVALGTFYDFYKIAAKYKINALLNTRILIVENQVETLINDDEKERLIEVYQNEKEPFVFKWLQSFSAYSNSMKLFRINQSEGQLDCLHGIRLMSMGWVVLGHVYAFSTSIADNPIILTDWTKRISFLIITNAFFSVDTFFLLSGLLTAYLFMKEVSRTNTISADFIFKYYVHRIWRITPPYMIMVMISATLTKYFGSGPFFPPNGFEIDSCKDSWWTNLLYINNLVRTDKMIEFKLIFGFKSKDISWYLGNDMQFHFIAPLILIPLALKNRLWNIFGITLSVVLLAASMISTAVIINDNPGTELGVIGPASGFYFQNIYITPWCRIAPFIVGILLGYFLFLNKTKCTYRLRLDVNTLIMLCMLILIGLILFGLYPDSNNNPLSKVTHILYQATSKFLWAIGLSYIIFACLNKQGGIINQILCMKIWVPLSKLSFSAYLVHFTVLNYYLSTQEHTLQLQDVNLVYIFLGTMVITYAVALIFSLLFEIPLIGLEKFIFKRK